MAIDRRGTGVGGSGVGGGRPPTDPRRGTQPPAPAGSRRRPARRDPRERIGRPPIRPAPVPSGISGSRHAYQDTRRFFAQVSGGLEELARSELEALGATDLSPGYRGLSFRAEPRALYRAAYLCRTVQKIIAPLLSFDCHSTTYLYRRAKGLPWAEFLAPDQTFAISANVSSSQITHSQYASLCLKDAIADSFRDRYGTRPSVERQTPDVRFHLYLHDNRAVIGLEVSGGSLHRRGYRRLGHEAPIQETVAAAVIQLAEWDGETPLVDPMCGSGTLLCEALMRFCRIPAGYLRPRFGFEALPDFDAGIWSAVRAEARARIRPLPRGLIRGSDLAPEAVAAARANLDQLPHGTAAAVQVMDFRNIPSLEGTTIVSNPPHGIRLQQAEGMEAFCEELGDFLKQRCRNSRAFLFFGNRELIKHIGLRTTWKKPLSSGGMDGRLIKLVLY